MRRPTNLSCYLRRSMRRKASWCIDCAGVGDAGAYAFEIDTHHVYADAARRIDVRRIAITPNVALYPSLFT